MTQNTGLRLFGDQTGGRPGLGFLQDTFEAAAVGLGLISLAGNWIRVNRRLCQKLGYSASELINHSYLDIVDPLDRHILHPDDKASHSNDTSAPARMTNDIEQTAQLRCHRKNGSWFWSQVTLNLVLGTDGRPTSFVCSVQDIHAQKTAEESLANERQSMVQEIRAQSAVFNVIREGMLVITPDDHVISCNPAFTDITDYTNEEIRGRHVSFLFALQHHLTDWAAIKASLAKNGNWEGESWNRRKSGDVYLDRTTVHALTDDAGRLLNYVLTSVDVTRMPHSQTELERLAYSDPLTGLPNRTLLMNRLDHAISRARRNTSTGAVMYIDLDGFKSVNDQYGHITGDELLKQVAGRLKRRLREVDTIARVGGDEFIAVLEEFRKPEGASIVAGALVNTLARPFDLEGAISVRISGSIGVALFAEDAPDATSIIAQADRALYVAKHAGRSCYRLAHEGASVN